MNHLVQIKAGLNSKDTTITIDGQRLKSVAAFAISASVGSPTRVSLTMYADIEISGEAEIVRKWRKAHLQHARLE